MKIAETSPGALKFHDQDLLNLSVGERWARIPERWNVQTVDFFRPEASCKHPLAEKFYEIILNPGILHFTGSNQKPWLNSCRHPYKKIFLHFLSQTQFADWHKVEKKSPKIWFRDFENLIKDKIRRRKWRNQKFFEQIKAKYMT